MKNLLKPLTSNRKWLPYAVALSLAALLLLVYTTRQNTTYQTQKVTRGTISADVQASGVLRARRSAKLEWLTGGVIDKVDTQIGEPVVAGQVLANLRMDSLSSVILVAESNRIQAKKTLEDLIGSDTAVATAWNNVVVAKHDVEDAQNQYDAMVGKRADPALNEYLQEDIDDAQARLDQLEFLWEMFYEKLSDNNARKMQMIVNITQARQNVSDQIARYNWFNGKTDPDLADKALAELNIAKGRLADAQRAYDEIKSDGNEEGIRKAQASLDAANSTVSMSLIGSPIDGTVSQLAMSPGDVVSPGTLAAIVEDRNSLGMDVLISEVDVVHIKPGMEVSIMPHSMEGESFMGLVTNVDRSGRLSDGVVSYKVEIGLVDLDDRLLSGMSADLIIRLANYENALLVPTSAIRFVEGQRIVFVNRAGQAVPVAIRVGTLTGDLAQVVGGNLEEGELVILDPPSMDGFDPALIQ